MRIPKESLEEFLSGAAARKKPDPPAGRSLRLTGEAKVLKPLARHEPVLEIKAPVGYRAISDRSNRLSVLGRSLFVSGAVALCALVVGAAVYLGLVGPATNAELAVNDLSPRRQTERVRTPPKLTIPVELGSAKDLTAIIDEPAATPPNVYTGRVRPDIRRAVHQPQRTERRISRPRLSHTNFVPTTLVIYAENGKIKTRVEPQLTAAYKKPLSISN